MAGRSVSVRSGADHGDDDDRERELAVDAQWKLIQKNCFTRWTNERLKTVNKHIADLETDLSDGLRLIALVEVLSGKVFVQKFTRRPTLRPQKLENVTMALRFLERDEGIRIVNIGNSELLKLSSLASTNKYCHFEQCFSTLAETWTEVWGGRSRRVSAEIFFCRPPKM